ncbi:MAG: hypothetical protein V2A58_08775, partial [Planctomycetota bacterium]
YDNIDHAESKDPSTVRYCLGLARLRRDGYVGLYATRYREGRVNTQGLMSAGTKLIINARCAPGGSVRVEVCDNFDEALEPCTFANCDPMTGDSVAHTVTWKGSAEIPVRDWRKLRFALRDAELFSFRFVGSGPE